MADMSDTGGVGEYGSIDFADENPAHPFGSSAFSVTSSVRKKDAVIQDIISTQTHGRSIESLQALVEQYASREHGLNKQHAELDSQLEAVYKQIVEVKAERAARTGKGALGAPLLLAKEAQREYRLKENLLTRLRSIEDRHNKDLLEMRERINQLRLEALDRTKVFDGLVADLNGVKGRLVEALEVSNAVLGERNELSDQLKTVKADDAEHKAAFEARLKDLNGQIAEMQAILVKAAKAGKLAAGGMGGGGGAGDGDGDGGAEGPGSGNLTEEQEEETRANINKLDHLIREYESVVQDLHAQTAQLQEVFKHMIAQAGLERLDQLVERFAEEEAFKYEIFGCVKESRRRGRALASLPPLLTLTPCPPAPQPLFPFPQLRRAHQQRDQAVRGDAPGREARAGAVH
jgi:hypothetical protein